MTTKPQTLTAEFLKVADEMGWERKPYGTYYNQESYKLLFPYPIHKEVHVVFRRLDGDSKWVFFGIANPYIETSNTTKLCTALRNIIAMKDIIGRGNKIKSKEEEISDQICKMFGM